MYLIIFLIVRARIASLVQTNEFIEICENICRKGDLLFKFIVFIVMCHVVQGYNQLSEVAIATDDALKAFVSL